MAGRVITAADIERRIAFVIQEANQPNPWYDQSVIYALRVATNFYCVSKNGGSDLIYRKGRYRSSAAHELIEKKAYKGLLINEHQEPLKVVWDWICKNKGQVTVVQVEKRLRLWPMVVITRIENGKIPKNELDPVKRYDGINVLHLGDDGKWALRE